MSVVGTLPMGRCEIADGECVMTRFLVLGPFLVPLDTAYIIGFGRSARSFPIQRYPKSVALAYLRWVVAPLALFITFLAAPDATWLLAMFGVAWLAAVLVAGRTFKDEARQRRVLASCIGHGAPPELLFRGTQELALIDLEKLWDLHGKVILSWRYLYPNDVTAHALPIYYALCRYDAALRGDPIMAGRARLAWERIARAASGQPDPPLLAAQT